MGSTRHLTLGQRDTLLAMGMVLPAVLYIVLLLGVPVVLAIIYSLNDVLWAMMTRCDPARDTSIVKRGWSGPLDPPIAKDQKGFSSRAIIDATKPYERAKDFPKASAASEGLKKAVSDKYGKYFSQKS